MKKYLRTIIYYAKNENKMIILFFSLRLLSSTVSIASPLLYSRVITNLLEHTLEQTMYSLLLLCVCQISTTVLGHFIRRVESKLSKKINYEVKKQVSAKVFSISPRYLNIDQGRLYSLIQNNSSVISSVLFTLIATVFSVITVLGVGVVVFFINWKLSLILLCTYPVNIGVNLFFNKRYKKSTARLYEQNDHFVGFLKHTLGNIREVSIQGGNKRIRVELNQKNGAVYQAALAQINVKTNYTTALDTVSQINHILLTVAGILFVYMGSIGFGDFIAFNTYSKNLSSSIDWLISLNTVLQPGLVSIDRLMALDEQYNNSRQAESQKNHIGSNIQSIKLEDVCFSIPSRNIINNISMDLRAGEIIGLSGANASGKTTIANLLLTNAIPTSGRILLNESANTDLAYDSIVQHITYIGTAKSLFNISIRDNMLISHNDTPPDDSTINEVCQRLNILDDILRLPEGFETVITDNSKLSSGQIQKIQLVRAMLCDSDVLILDEAISNLDSRTKDQVKDYLLELKRQGKIIIIISHVPEDYSICDRTYIVKNGCLFSDCGE